MLVIKIGTAESIKNDRKNQGNHQNQQIRVKTLDTEGTSEDSGNELQIPDGLANPLNFIGTKIPTTKYRPSKQVNISNEINTGKWP